MTDRRVRVVPLAEQNRLLHTLPVWARGRIASSEQEVARLTALVNTPELIDFTKAVQMEAAHQRERWGTEHDVGKQPTDWLWLIGYLAGKALQAHIAGNRDKALHHTISTAAACANWHAAILGTSTTMQPGHAPSAARGEQGQ